MFKRGGDSGRFCREGVDADVRLFVNAAARLRRRWLLRSREKCSKPPQPMHVKGVSISAFFFLNENSLKSNRIF